MVSALFYNLFVLFILWKIVSIAIPAEFYEFQHARYKYSAAYQGYKNNY